MRLLIAVIAGIAGAVVGWALTGIATVLIAGYLGVSDFEGARGMLAFLGIGPIGGLIAMVASVWLALRIRRRHESTGRRAANMVLALVAIGLLTAGGFWLMWMSDDQLVRNGPSPQVDFEIRLPLNAKLPGDTRDISIDLQTDRNTNPAYLRTDWQRNDNGRPVIRGGVELFFRTTQRTVVLSLPGEPVRLFLLKLPGNPSASADYAAWQRVDFIDERKPDSRPRKPQAGEDYEIRYRVERVE